MSTVHEAEYRHVPGTEFLNTTELLLELQEMEHLKNERAYETPFVRGQVIVEPHGSFGLSEAHEGPWTDSQQRLEKIIVTPSKDGRGMFYGLVRAWNGQGNHKYVLTELAHDDTPAFVKHVLEPGEIHTLSRSSEEPEKNEWETMVYLDPESWQLVIAHKGKGDAEVLGATTGEYQTKSPFHPKLWAASFE